MNGENVIYNEYVVELDNHVNCYAGDGSVAETM